MKQAGLILAIAFGAIGLVVALGAWNVGYCGALTPDAAPPGTLRHDLCKGTSGNLMGALVVACWVWAGVAPALGAYLADRRGSTIPLAILAVLGAIPIATIAILAEVLPQS